MVDKAWRRVLRHRILFPFLLAAAYVGLAALLGLAPIAHPNDSFGWQMLNGEILLGAVGLAVAGARLITDAITEEVSTIPAPISGRL